MENLIVYPENDRQLSVVKSFLEEMKIHFKNEKEVDKLQDWQKKSIDEGLKDFEEDRSVSREELSRKAWEYLK